jgi:tetratricopeptide (TPR) repeat protein
MAPTNVDVAINLGGAYILQGKWNKAVRVLSRAAELHPDNVMVWINLGAAQLGRLELSGPQQQERAIKAYERALALDPQAPNVHYSLGLIYKDRGDIDKATAAFEHALTVNPADADARYWLGWLARQRAALAAQAEAGSNSADEVSSEASSDLAASSDGAIAPGASAQGESGDLA